MEGVRGAELGQRRASAGEAWPLPPANAETPGPPGDMLYVEKALYRRAGQPIRKALGKEKALP